MNIYVGNLSPEITEDELRKEFMAFGEVISVIIMSDRGVSSGQSRGYGYVEMTSKSEGQTAIANLTGRDFRGRQVNIIEALPLSDKRRLESHQMRSNNQITRGRKRRYQTS